jgi:hypothetical protein
MANKKKLDYEESSELSDPDPTPKKKPTDLKRSYAIADIAGAFLDAAESEHETQVLDDEYEPHTDIEPAPKKRQKTIKVPVREAINSNRKEYEPHKAENKVSRLIVIDCTLNNNVCVGL